VIEAFESPGWLFDPGDERGWGAWLDEIFDELPALRGWRPFVEAHCGLCEGQETGDDAVRVARIERLPPGASADQTTLAAAD
jgi:hypothetical protein